MKKKERICVRHDSRHVDFRAKERSSEAAAERNLFSKFEKNSDGQCQSNKLLPNLVRFS